jgi:NAD(P)-dependent dehydrogenase (short-subunit alcohol dehydrogenase family)
LTESALVTDGSSGLGFEIDKVLLARGLKVAITVVPSAVEELRKSGGTVSNAIAIIKPPYSDLETSYPEANSRGELRFR